jgi:hypothetical protein
VEEGGVGDFGITSFFCGGTTGFPSSGAGGGAGVPFCIAAGPGLGHGDGTAAVSTGRTVPHPAISTAARSHFMRLF